MVKKGDGEEEPSYRGILDEWAREQDRARDKTAREGDNGERGPTVGVTQADVDAEYRTHIRAYVASETRYWRDDAGAVFKPAYLIFLNDLLGMVARLERENAALREIAQAVAQRDDGYCADCHAIGQHAQDCPTTKARVLLAGERSSAEGEGG